jgi:hypothetical protein
MIESQPAARIAYPVSASNKHRQEQQHCYHHRDREPKAEPERQVHFRILSKEGLRVVQYVAGECLS